MSTSLLHSFSSGSEVRNTDADKALRKISNKEHFFYSVISALKESQVGGIKEDS